MATIPTPLIPGADQPYQAVRSSFPVNTKSYKSFEELIGKIAAVQSNRAMLESLDVSPKPTKKRGIVETLLDQRHGILSAPSRAISAALMQMAGNPTDNKELAKYGDPFSAAAASFKGKFAVTGGDVFKTNKDDSIPERLAKWTGALGYDLATDPLNWFGGEGTISRKLGGDIAVRQGDELLQPVLRAVEDAGKNSKDLIEELAKSTPMYERLRKDFAANIPKGVKPAEHAANVAKWAPTEEQMRQLAGEAYGNIIAESLNYGGRGRIRQEITKLVGDERVAGDILAAYPAHISGGLYLKNPVTGKIIKRVAGGRGDSNIITEFLNRGRFYAGARVAPLTGKLGGRFGVGRAEVLTGMRKAEELFPRVGGKLVAPGRATLAEHVLAKDTWNLVNSEIGRQAREALAEIQAVQELEKAFDKPADRDAFVAKMNRYFHNLEAGREEPGNTLDEAAFMAATRLHELMKPALDDMRARGMEIGFASPYYVPLMLTDEAVAARRITTPRGAGYSRVSPHLNPSRERDVYTLAEADGLVMDTLGYKNASGEIKYMTPMAINAEEASRLGYKKYEEDPFKIVSKYMSMANRSQATYRFAEAARSLGIIAKLPPNVETLVNLKRAAMFNSAVQRTKGAAVKAATEREKQATAALRDLVSQTRVEALQTAIKAEMGVAREAWQTAKDEEAVARAELQAADAELRKLTPRLQKISDEFTAHGTTGVDVAAQDAKKVARAAEARVRRAQARLSAINGEIEAARQELELAQQIGTPEDIAAATARRDAAETAGADAADRVYQEFTNLETLQYEVQASMNVAGGEAVQRGRKQLEDIAMYQNAQRRADEAATRLSAAREARLDAWSKWNSARRTVDPTRVALLGKMSDDYVAAKQNYARAKQALSNVKKSARTEAQQAALDVLKEEVRSTFKAISDVFQGSHLGQENLVNNYLRELKSAADKLSVEQRRAFEVITNAERLGDMVYAANYSAQVNGEISMNLMGDIYATYKTLRDLIPEEEFKKLSQTAQDLARGKRGELLDERGVLPKAADELLATGSNVGIGTAEEAADVKLPRALEYAYSNKGIAAIMEQMYTVENNTASWRKFIDKVYDPLYLVWKTGVTVGRGPAYTITNLVGGLMNNYLGGVGAKYHKLSAAVYAETVRLYRKYGGAEGENYLSALPKIEMELRKKFGNIEIGGKNIIDLYVEYLERGGFFSSEVMTQLKELSDKGLLTGPQKRTPGVVHKYTPDATGKIEKPFYKTANFILNNPVQNVLNDMASGSETFLRFAAFMEGYSRYTDVASAMDFMYMLHFDYQDLAPAELWLKRVVPFYTWTRNNVPLQLRYLFFQTGKMRNLFNANEEAKQAFGADDWLQEYMPEFMAGQGGFTSMFKFGGNHLGLFYKSPIMDLNKFFQVGYLGSIPVPMPVARELGNSLGPVIKTPIEVLFSINLATGQKYDNTGDAMQNALQTAFPYYRTGRNIASAAGLPVDKERRVSNLMGLIVGAPWGATTITEKTMKWAAIQRNAELSKQVKQAAADAGVDVEWLRRQVEKGTSPVDIQMAILTGEGNARLIALEEQMNPKKKGPGRDWESVFQGLVSGQSNTGY